MQALSVQSVTDKSAQAWVRGQPLEQLPLDLYIPPDALAVILEAFEGPLDLLLYLIKKQNLDILDIDVFAIAQQYNEYVQLLQAHQVDLAAEYLLMAATLAEIKSRMLLPKLEAEQDEDEQDPRAELVRRLQAYELCRQGADHLQTLPREGQNWWQPPAMMQQLPPMQSKPEAQLSALVKAWQELQRREQHQRSHQIQADGRSPSVRLAQLRLLLQPDQLYQLQDLVEEPQSAEDWVVNFMAVMELAKEGFVRLEQLELFGRIYLRRHTADSQAMDQTSPMQQEPA